MPPPCCFLRDARSAVSFQVSRSTRKSRQNVAGAICRPIPWLRGVVGPAQDLAFARWQRRTKGALKVVLWMAEIHSHHLSNPESWNEVYTNQQWFPMVSKWCRSTVAAGKQSESLAKRTGTKFRCPPGSPGFAWKWGSAK